MLCEKCRIREATIQYTEVVNGVKTEHNFCAQCAGEMDLGQDFPLGRLLSGLLGLGESSQKEETYAQVVCPTCKTSYGDFIKDSRFGCPDCYEVFDLLISDKMKQLHGSDSHRGKKARPAKIAARGRESLSTKECVQNREENSSLPLEERIRRLRACQEAAVRREDYEEAARYRDEIKKLKAGSETDA